MTKQLEQSITELLDASRDDLETMRLPVNDRTFGFHAQQAIEKLLKALIAGHEQEFEYTHDLDRLIVHLATLEEKVPVPVALPARLTMYAGRFRYQKPTAFDQDDRAEVLDATDRLSSAVLARLAELCPELVWPSA